MAHLEAIVAVLHIFLYIFAGIGMIVVAYAPWNKKYAAYRSKMFKSAAILGAAMVMLLSLAAVFGRPVDWWMWPLSLIGTYIVGVGCWVIYHDIKHPA